MKTATVNGKKFKGRPLGAPRIGKKTSIVWNFFKALPKENGTSMAVCLLCKHVFKNSQGSTTGMRGHLEKKHPGAIKTGCSQLSDNENQSDVEYKPGTSLPTLKSRTKTPPTPHLSMENGAVGGVGETEVFEQDSTAVVATGRASRILRRHQSILPGPPPQVNSETGITPDMIKSVVMHLVSSMLPVRHVEEPFFKQMLTQNQTADSILEEVVNALDDLYQEAKQDIKTKLHEKPVTIGLQIWTKTNSQIYAIVSANFVNGEWGFENCFLGLRLLTEVGVLSDQETVTRKVSTVLKTLLKEYDIKLENVVHVLAHTGSVSLLNTSILNVTTWPCLNDTIYECYELLNSFAVSTTDCDVLNNCLKLGKKVLPDYKELKRHPGKLMTGMKTWLTLNSASENLPLKVETLDECIKLQEPFGVIVDCLLEQGIMPASSILPLIFMVRNMYEDKNSTEMDTWSKERRQELTSALSTHFEGSFKLNLSSNDLGDPLLAVCTFLDPRYKKLRFLTEEQRNYVYDSVIQLLHELGKGKLPGSDTGRIISVRSENPAYTNDPLNPSTSTTSSSQSTKLAALLSTVVHRQMIKLPSDESMKELNNYWTAPVAPLNMDPYQWWSYNQERYPKLSELAKRYLCIPGNCTLARLIWTGAGRKFYDNLANIEPEYVEQLQVLRCYYNHNVQQTEISESCVSQASVDPKFGIKTENRTMETVDLIDEEM